MKHKIPNLLKPLGTIIYQNSQFYYLSEPFNFHHFTMRHPVATFWFSKPFFYIKNLPNLYDFFFFEEYKNRGLTFFINVFWQFWFFCTLFPKNGPKFWHSIPNQAKSLEYFYSVFVDLCPCLYTTKLSYTQLFKWGHPSLYGFVPWRLVLFWFTNSNNFRYNL